jgi:tetratricopeptide (TPR) repeat protein
LLSDQGRHEQAIAMLRKATASEPANVEAWANLTLAYSRQGGLEEGIAAGLRGLGLNPDHYWLNLVSAQMYFERKQWSEVIALGQRALVGAPNPQERARTLALLGRSYDRLNKTNDACRMFVQANALQPAQEIVTEIKNLGCPSS